MRMQINWNAVTAVCAIVVALLTASGWLTDGLREDIRDLRREMRGETVGMRQEMREEFGGMRQEIREEFGGMRQEMAGMRQELREDIKDLRREMREGFAETRENIKALQQDVAFIKGQSRADQTTNGNARHPSSGSQGNRNPE